MTAPDLRQSAIDTAQDLRDDLEAIAESDLPFGVDAERILDELNEAQENDQ